MITHAHPRTCTPQENKAGGEKPRRGRPPRCIILAPTRELANQVRMAGDEMGHALYA